MNDNFFLNSWLLVTIPSHGLQLQMVLKLPVKTIS